MSNQTCQACGGVIGRDCFNPQECMEITQRQAACYRELSDQQNQAYREYTERLNREQAALHAIESIIDGWDDWEADAGQQAQIDQDDRTWRHVMRTHIATCLWRAFGWPMSDEELRRDVSWKPRNMTTKELLDTLRRNHLSLGRDDSPYWQAEQKIRELLQTFDMVAALVSRCGHQDDVCLQEIKRLAETAEK